MVCQSGYDRSVEDGECFVIFVGGFFGLYWNVFWMYTK